MSDDANALLKGMLGIQNDKKKENGEKKTKPKGPKPTNGTPPKSRKLSNASQSNVKNTRGKRGGGKKNITADAGESNNEECGSKPNNNGANSKKKRNKKRESQGGNEEDGETKKTPQLKKYDSDKHNAQTYAWSAFQSSPDPSALPDVGGLFLGGEDSEAKEPGEGSKEKEGLFDDGDENEVKESEEGADEKEGVDLGSSVSSLTFGPPSDHIRSSLVNSMLAKNVGSVNAGEALLKSLTSPTRQSFSNTMPPLHEQFRTAESLEAEMLSPSLKPEEKSDADHSSLPRLNLIESASDEKDSAEKDGNEAKEDDTIQTKGVESSVSPNPAEQPPPPMRKDYPDAISQLMYPGGFGGGGYGVHPHMSHYPQHTPQHHAPYNFPLNHGHPGYLGHHGPPYPMPHQQQHPPHSYHPMQPNIRPQFTTLQVRVPQALLPGNTMIVEGMQIQVPPGVPPGAIIPVNIPLPNPQQYYGHPPPHPPNFHGGFHPHMPPHPQGQPMMPPRQQMPPPPPQHHQNQPTNHPPPSSWAAKVANGSEKGNTEPKKETSEPEPKD